jgi:hypothetical protein
MPGKGDGIGLDSLSTTVGIREMWIFNRPEIVPGLRQSVDV